MPDKPKIAVVSPFLDKRHGTERRVVEGIRCLIEHYEFHLYSQRVEDLDLNHPSVVWHRVPDIPGPHLLKYLWWFGANHFWRWKNRRSRSCHYDLVYSPGVNCLDADVCTVHITFAEFYRRVRGELSLGKNPLASWPRLIHRQIYYRLIMALEKRVYSRRNIRLAAVSRKTAGEIVRYYQPPHPVTVLYHGIDHTLFNPQRRFNYRESVRQQMGFSERDFVLLLIGNDWKQKGLTTLLKSLSLLPDLPLILLVVGRDDPSPYKDLLERFNLSSRVRFSPPSPEVWRFYAVADLYVGPSLEDAFALPPAEAMACGLPVVVSREAGVSEIVTDGEDALVLQDPTNAEELAGLIRRVYEDAELRWHLAENATRTMQEYTWERNAHQLAQLFEEVLVQKGRGGDGQR